jgi:hypothetical protein
MTGYRVLVAARFGSVSGASRYEHVSKLDLLMPCIEQYPPSERE